MQRPSAGRGSPIISHIPDEEIDVLRPGLTWRTDSPANPPAGRTDDGPTALLHRSIARGTVGSDLQSPACTVIQLRELEFLPSDAPLREDVSRLGRAVGEMLREQEGSDFLATVEHLRTTA